MKNIGFFLTALALMTACGKPVNNGRVCTMEARAGLQVTVRNATTNRALSDSTTVLISAGTYTELLQTFPGSDSVYTGAWERSGTYIINVSRNGYKPASYGPVILEEDGCHVITQSHTIPLEKK